MHNACIIYSSQLVNVGYSMLAIDEIVLIREKLQDGNFVQEVFKKSVLLTEDRIIVLNKCYNTMVLINAAAQLVFRTDYAKQKQYVYNPSPGSDVDEEELEGTVAVSTTKPLLLLALRMRCTRSATRV